MKATERTSVPTVSILLIPQIVLTEEDKRTQDIYSTRGRVHDIPRRALERVVRVRMSGTANRIDWTAQGTLRLSEDGKHWTMSHNDYPNPGRAMGSDPLPDGAGRQSWAEVRALPESEAMRALLDKHAPEWAMALAKFRNEQLEYVEEQQARCTAYEAWATILWQGDVK